MNISLRAQIAFPVLTVARDVVSQEEGGKLPGANQWRLPNIGEEILNIIPLVKCAVVWRKTVERSVYTIRVA